MPADDWPNDPFAAPDQSAHTNEDGTPKTRRGRKATTNRTPERQAEPRSEQQHVTEDSKAKGIVKTDPAVKADTLPRKRKAPAKRKAKAKSKAKSKASRSKARKPAAKKQAAKAKKGASDAAAK